LQERVFYSNVSLASGSQIYLERPQIYRLLEKAARSSIVTVVAGAGYGKTHSVYSFVRNYNVSTAWIQFSERDNLGWRFWENFVQAVAAINKDTSAKLAEIGFPETERQFERYLHIPTGDNNPEQKYIFVYDDYHLLHDKAVLRFLEHSITSPFPNITSIIISRNEPKINIIPLMSKGILFQVTEEDLRFSREEMLEYFRLQNIKPDTETASRVYRDTEGWAFAIHLAGLALKNEPPGKGYALSSMRLNLFKLIESEVMNTISKKLRHFLIKLSFIEHLAVELIGELAAGTNLLKEMGQIGSFIRLDTYSNSYLIHHLFLDYLRGKQGEIPEDERKEVWAKAAKWCEENNLKIDAITYYEKAGDYENIIKVVYQEFPLSLPNRIAQFILELLDRAPKELFRQNPAAWVIRAQALMIQEQFDLAMVELKEIIATLEAETPTPFHYQVLSGCYNGLGFIGLTTCMYTRDYSYVPWFERGYYYHRLSGFTPSGAAAVASLSAYVCRVSVPDQGEIEKYIEANTGMVAYVTQSTGGLYAGIDDLARAEYAFFRTDIVAGEQYAYQALYKAQKANQYEIETRAIYYLIRMSMYNGTYDKIQGFFKLLEAQLTKKDYINRYTDHDIVMGGFYLQIRQTDKIVSWIKNDFEESEITAINFGLEVLLRAKYHYYEGRYQSALAAMANQKSIYSYTGLLFGKIVFKFLEALCRYRLDDIPAAIKNLEASYELASPNGIDLPFIELGRDTRSLIEVILKGNCECSVPREWLEHIHRSSSAYAKKALVAAEMYGTPEKRETSTGLSRRELGVLTGLSQGLTREELAEDNNISINTVKSVIKSVYNKLGAVNRADAIRIATSQGLLKNNDKHSKL
jgi:LuxR family maltose regulon positive regulatory protein